MLHQGDAEKSHEAYKEDAQNLSFMYYILIQVLCLGGQRGKAPSH